MHPKTKSILEHMVETARRQGVEVGEVRTVMSTDRFRGFSELREYAMITGEHTLLMLRHVSEIEDIIAMEDL